MGSRVRDILARIKTDLAGINGSGSYNYDLSGDNQVIVAQAMDPVRVPCVYIYSDGMDTAQSPGRTVLTQYDRTLRVMCVGYVAATNDDPEELHLRTWDMLADMQRALEADRGLGPSGSFLCDDLELSMVATDGAQVGRPTMGIAVVALSVSFRQDSGSPG